MLSRNANAPARDVNGKPLAQACLAAVIDAGWPAVSARGNRLRTRRAAAGQSIMPNRGSAQITLMLEIPPVWRLGSTSRGSFAPTAGHDAAIIRAYSRHPVRADEPPEQTNLFR